jgi:hypothetical protein
MSTTPRGAKIRRLTKKEWVDGTWQPAELLDWLNLQDDSPEKNRVIGLLGRIQKAGKMTAVVDFDFAFGDPSRDYSVARKMPLDTLRRDYRKLLGEINELLSRYKCSPFIGCQVDRDAWYVGWDPLDEPEQAAIVHLLISAQMGVIERIARCRTCRLWFFGRRRASFCSTKCRQASYRASENGKATKRNYMRRYMRAKRAGKK